MIYDIFPNFCFHLFEDYGYSLGAQYVMKMDDDTCIKPHKLVEYLDAYAARHPSRKIWGFANLYRMWWRFFMGYNMI